jgi:hypothetical protein
MPALRYDRVRPKRSWHLTGTISDPGGAVVLNAPVEAKNVETSAAVPGCEQRHRQLHAARTSDRHQRTLCISHGLEKFIQEGILLPVAQTVRVDAILQVGAASESVTIYRGSGASEN